MTTLGNFPSATSIATTDYIPIEQGGVLKKATPSLLPFVQSGTGALTRTVQTKAREACMSITDFTGVDSTGVTDSTAGAALAEAAAGNRILFWPAGTYKFSSDKTFGATVGHYFEQGAKLSVDSGKTVTFSGQVISLYGDFRGAGLGTVTLTADTNVVLVPGTGIGFGTHVPSGSDDRIHFEYAVNNSYGTILNNPSTGSSAQAFKHIFAGEQDVTGSDSRWSVQSAAAGGEVNLTAKINSLATNPNAALNIINLSNSPVAIYANGFKQVKVLPTSVATANVVTFKGGASGSSVIRSAEGDANISIIDDVPGTGSYFVRTGSANAIQLEVAHTASATRRIKLTGSNGGNPTIDASAGLVTIGGTSGTLNIATGGSTTISTGVGSVKMSSANAATNAAWIPFAYAGTTYYVPGWTTNSP